MAARIHELRAQRAKLAKDANAALETAQAKAKAEARELSAEELKAQDDFDTQLQSLSAEITLEEKKNDRAALYGSSDRRVAGSGPQIDATERAAADPRRGFSSHRDFFLSVIENAGLRDRADVSDDRLRPLAVVDKDDKQSAGELAFMLPAAFAPKATIGSDEQGEYSDTYGGFAVPRTRLPGMLSVGFEGDPTAGLTQNIPMASPTVDIMARTDKDHTTSVSGGFTVARRAETAAIVASRMGLEMITLKASGLFGLAYATEELLADSPMSFAAIIDAGFRTQFGAHILNEKIRGLGGDQYLGILNSGAKVEVAKEAGQAADTIVSQNIIKMAARSWGFDKAVWVANHDTKPQLAVLSIAIGTAGALLYTPSPRDGFPDMLWGRPIYYTEFAATVGDVGDISLVDWSQYLEGTYQPIQGAESIHVRFVNHERAFKLWTRNAGAPWWRTALTPAKSANTLSPIVTLAARA